MPKQTLCLLFGGRSSEHEVSLSSVTQILKHIDVQAFDVVTVGITKEGKWFLYEGPTEQSLHGQWEQFPGLRPAILSPDRGVHGLLIFQADGSVSTRRVDVLYPVLHGSNGEDGSVQGLAQLAGIPCVGPGVTSSACCMDKSVTKVLLQDAGIPQAKWVTVHSSEVENDVQAAADRAEAALPYPLFVKPASTGSSVGVGRADDRQALVKALLFAARYGERILVEEMIVGREIETAVIGNAEPAVVECGEVIPRAAFYDYESKYTAGAADILLPAPMPEASRQALETYAVQAYKACGCAGLTRIDFFLKENGEVLVNELNTLPGFTPTSMYPLAWVAAGGDYGELITRLCRLAQEVQQRTEGFSHERA